MILISSEPPEKKKEKIEKNNEEKNDGDLSLALSILLIQSPLSLTLFVLSLLTAPSP